MRNIFFIGLLFLSLDLSAYYELWIDPSSSILSEEAVGPHTPAAVFNIRDLNPAFKNGIEIGFATVPNAMRLFRFYFLNAQGQRVCTNGQLSPSPPNECYYLVYSFTNVFVVLSDNIQSVVIGGGCSQNCMSQVDPNHRIAVFPRQPIVNSGVAKKVCPNGQLIDGPIYTGDHLRVSAKIDPGLSCEGSELVVNSSETEKYYTTQLNADSEGIFSFDINPLPAYMTHFWIYAKGKNSQNQIRPIGGTGVSWSMQINPQIYSVDVYQVIKNPILFAPSTAIDLVAGKNADIIVETNLVQVDITGTVLEWKNKLGVVKQTFFPKSNQTDSAGNIIFEIDPVPKEEEFVGGETTLAVKLVLNNGCGSNFVARTSLRTVHIRKTKPIRVGFVPISGCNRGVDQCFKGATYEDALEFKNKSMEIFRLWYPVDNEVIDHTIVYQADAMASSGSSIDLSTGKNIYSENNVHTDFANLKGFRSGNQYDFIVGVVDKEYFQKFNNHANIKDSDGVELFPLGFAPYPLTLEKNSMPSIVVKGSFFALPHEIAHNFGISHNFNLSSGLSSYSLSAPWININRSVFYKNKKSIMNPSGPGTDQQHLASDYWIYEEDYLEIFRNLANYGISGGNLNFYNINLQKQDYKNYFKFLNIFEKRDNGFKKINAKHNFINYIFNVLDKNKNTVYSDIVAGFNIIPEYPDVPQLQPAESKIFNIQFPAFANSMFIEIKSQSKNEQPLNIFTIGTLQLQNSLNYLDNGSIISTDKKKIRNQIQSLINQFDSKMKSSDFITAEKFLTEQFRPFISSNLTDNFTPANSISFGKNNFIKELTKASLNIVVNIYPSAIDANGIISIRELEKNNIESKIKINLLKKTNNSNKMIIIRTWLNGVETDVFDIQDGNVYLFQGQLVPGDNYWVSKSYLIDSRLYKTSMSSINQFLKEKNDIQKKIETGQLTPEEIVKLNSRSIIIGKLIDELNNQIVDNQMPIGNQLQLTVHN